MCKQTVKNKTKRQNPFAYLSVMIRKTNTEKILKHCFFFQTGYMALIHLSVQGNLRHPR